MVSIQEETFLSGGTETEVVTVEVGTEAGTEVGMSLGPTRINLIPTHLLHPRLTVQHLDLLCLRLHPPFPQKSISRRYGRLT